MGEVSRYSVHRQATIRTTVCGVDRATDRAPRWVCLCYRGYLLKQFAATPAAHDPRRGELIASVLEDFGRLSAADAARTGQHHVRDHFTIRRFEHDAAVANLSREAIAKSADRKRRRPIHPSPIRQQVSPFANPHTVGSSILARRRAEPSRACTQCRRWLSLAAIRNRWFTDGTACLLIIDLRSRKCRPPCVRNSGNRQNRYNV